MNADTATLVMRFCLIGVHRRESAVAFDVALWLTALTLMEDDTVRARLVPLGRISLEEARAHEDAAMASLSERTGDPAIFMAEHHALYTVGRAGVMRSVSPGDPARWPNVGNPRHPVVEIDRGGDAHYHGPGQLVVYPVFPLKALGMTLIGYLRTLEDSGIEALARWGVEAFRRKGLTGIWAGDGEGPAKIGSIGVGCRRWVTYHGMSINVDCDMEDFSAITPCGLVGERVTSVAELARDDPSVQVPSVPELGRDVARALARAVGLTLDETWLMDPHATPGWPRDRKGTADA